MSNERQAYADEKRLIRELSEELIKLESQRVTWRETQRRIPKSSKERHQSGLCLGN
jgi:hypothetical protein